MSKFGITLVLVLLAVVCISGCSTPETYSERVFRISQSQQLDMRMIIDDFDYVFLLERNSSLSKWHQRLGY
jgi:excinuclease UvrABC helicase subunit UvrB